MLSYQHSYHAGGPADVHKHAALSLLLGHLNQKDKPFTVIDLYAGSGIYDLTGPEALKTQEYRAGIAKLWKDEDAARIPGGSDYLAAVRSLNGASLIQYPGSPMLARRMLRDADRLTLNE